MNTVNPKEEDHHARSNFVRTLVQRSADEAVATSMFTRKIPKRIIQFWDDLDRLPVDVSECIGTWSKAEEQGIERLLFDKRAAGDFIYQKLGLRYKLAYDRCYHPAMQSDFFHFVDIFSEGGCYIDADDVFNGAEIQHLFSDERFKIQPLCYDKVTHMMVPPSLFTQPGANAESWIFYFNNNPLIAASGHTVLKQALNQATLSLEKDLTNGLPEIQSTTGPGNLTKSIFDAATEIGEIEHKLLVLSNWEDIAESRWKLDYRNDTRKLEAFKLSKLQRVLTRKRSFSIYETSLSLVPSTSKFLFRIALRCRRLLPPKKCQAFGTLNTQEQPRIERIYVINLNRQPARWTQIEHELKGVRDWTGDVLWNLAEKYAAVDAKNFLQFSVNDADIDAIYTLGDQLFVEPQPLAIPTSMELNSPIEMSRPEIAVAHSHIGIWRQVVDGNHEYVLVLEDDVWFRPGFAKDMNQAWAEITTDNNTAGNFDILYLSYEEVKHGAPKTILSNKIFRPVRGLWNLSGYVISRKGAEKLLQLLPCRGPIDLWLNHQFEFLNAIAIKKSVISQRPDFSSTNSYSILPALTKIGAITSEGAALFQIRPSVQPVFVFGPKNSGLTSLAMALSMLGYTCCSDLQTLPASELEPLLVGKDDRIFDAYVNINALASEIQTILKRYPHAKFILTTSKTSVVNEDDLIIIEKLYGTNIAVVDIEAPNKWQIVCEHLKCAPPICSFPELADIGQRRLISKTVEMDKALSCKIPKRDKSPWVIGLQQSWKGIQCVPREVGTEMGVTTTIANDCFKFIDPTHWLSRDDTFTDNLALFRPSNVELLSGLGVALTIKRENLGVREYSAASLTSRNKYLYGRFEAAIKVSNAPGVVTGFFLHRDSPRQEIDIEIAGNRTDHLLVNVFYNPGGDGAKFDYGYRGAATCIDLGFDASESYHRFAVEWGPTEIRWFVDNHLIHRRVDWDPTPIPHLPMSLHANVWPCRSKELAGRLTNRRLPTTTFIKSIAIEANQL